MKNVVVTGCPRANFGRVGALARHGVQYVDYHGYQEAGS
jgi:hypothetical protein